MSNRRRWSFALAFLVLALAGAGAPTASVTNDNDYDGIDDGFEAQLAAQFLPEIRYDWWEDCDTPDTRPVLFRLRHPSVNGVVDTNYIAINYVRLYNLDCGGHSSHWGDNEPFLVFLKLVNGTWTFSTISATNHAGTIFEEPTASFDPILWVSRSKHANYAELSKCDGGIDHCSWDGPTYSHTLYNVGEPTARLTNHLGDVYWAWNDQYAWNDPQFLDAGHIETYLYTSPFMHRTVPPALHACLVSCDEQFRQCRRAGTPMEQCLDEQTLCQNYCYYENRTWDP